MASSVAYLLFAAQYDVRNSTAKSANLLSSREGVEVDKAASISSALVRFRSLFGLDRTPAPECGGLAWPGEHRRTRPRNIFLEETSLLASRLSFRGVARRFPKHLFYSFRMHAPERPTPKADHRQSAVCGPAVDGGAGRRARRPGDVPEGQKRRSSWRDRRVVGHGSPGAHLRSQRRICSGATLRSRGSRTGVEHSQECRGAGVGQTWNHSSFRRLASGKSFLPSERYENPGAWEERLRHSASNRHP